MKQDVVGLMTFYKLGHMIVLDNCGLMIVCSYCGLMMFRYYDRHPKAFLFEMSSFGLGGNEVRWRQKGGNERVLEHHLNPPL